LLLAMSLTVEGAVFSGCASSPALDRYSRSEIERPLTLPEGVTTWHIPMVFAHIEDKYGSTTIPPVPIPLFWDTSPSDDFTLHWAPLPLAGTYQISKTPMQRWGLNVGTGLSYGETPGFRVHPMLGLSFRQRLAERWALDMTPSYTAIIPFKDGQDYNWSSKFEIGSLSQLTDEFAIEPYGAVEALRGNAAFSRVSFGDRKNYDDITVNLTVGIQGVWSAGRQWDIRPAYAYSGIASNTSLRAHLAWVDFVHFW
jgi:hypothetical protein